MSPNSTETSEKKFEVTEVKEAISDVELVPLNDSITYEEVAESIHDEESKEDSSNKGLTYFEKTTYSQSSKVMEDLEKLLETGYAELIRSSSLLSQGDDVEEWKDIEEEEKKSPFPTGMQVFDDNNDDFEEL